MKKSKKVKKVTSIKNSEVTKDRDGSLNVALNIKMSEIREIFGTDDTSFVDSTMSQLLRIESSSGEIDTTKLRSNLSLLKGFDLQDEVETMIAISLISLHKLTNQFFLRALVKEQPSEIIDSNVHRINKLLGAYEKQLSLLMKYRNKGSQKIKVEHINIENGGKAIFTNIQGEGGQL